MFWEGIVKWIGGMTGDFVVVCVWMVVDVTKRVCVFLFRNGKAREGSVEGRGEKMKGILLIVEEREREDMTGHTWWHDMNEAEGRCRENDKWEKGRRRELGEKIRGCYIELSDER